MREDTSDQKNQWVYRCESCGLQWERRFKSTELICAYCNKVTSEFRINCDPESAPEPTLQPTSALSTQITEPNIVDQTIAERGKIYGDPQSSHANIGHSWTGLIQQHYGITLDHPLPDFLVALMMTTFKAQRSARVFSADNYIDLSAYAKFAQDFQKPTEKK